MAHFYALFCRQQQISNSFLRMDDMTEDELFQCMRFTRLAVVELLNLCSTTLSDRQADITPFLPIRSCSPPSSSSLRAASNGWSVAAVVCRSRLSVLPWKLSPINSLIKVAPHYINFPLTSSH